MGSVRERGLSEVCCCCKMKEEVLMKMSCLYGGVVGGVSAWNVGGGQE